MNARFAGAIALFALAAQGCSGRNDPAAQETPHPAAVTNPTACEGHVETVYALPDTPGLIVDAIAVGPDGTVYFSQLSPRGGGIYAVAPGAASPRPITTRVTPDRLWVDDDKLLAADGSVLYEVAIATGDARRVSGVPGAFDVLSNVPGPFPDMIATSYALDATHVYTFTIGYYDEGEAFDVWRLPRAGGDAERLFHTPMIHGDATSYAGGSSPIALGRRAGSCRRPRRAGSRSSWTLRAGAGSTRTLRWIRGAS